MDRYHLHLVSDSTGETVISVARACLAQFETMKINEHFWNLVRSDRQLSLVLDEIETHRGLVLYTLLDEKLRMRLEAFCAERSLPCLSILDPVFTVLQGFFGVKTHQARPGRQHAMNAAYFNRVEAIDFAIAHDDGQAPERLRMADVILVGVSRTSKTPTCLYLANKGIKAANVPLVPDIPLPDTLFSPDLTALIVALTADSERLVDIRRTRLRSINQRPETDYVDSERVREEVLAARKLYTAQGWPMIDVTRRSIEETAAEILKLWKQRRPSGDLMELAE